MAKKKIGIYTDLVGTFNNKVEDLYLIVDRDSIVFTVKNIQTNQFVAFEHFVNSADNAGWHQLIAYLQNNSKLIQHVFANVHFVWNHSRYLVTKKLAKEDSLRYQQELDFVHGTSTEEELYFKNIEDDKMLVYSVPDALSTLLSRSFPTGKWHHYVEYVLAQSAKDAALLFLFENNYCLRLIKNGQNQLINNFTMEGDDQNCYSILNACSNILSNLTQTQLKVWGVTELQNSFVNALVPYFNNFEMVLDQIGDVQTTLNKNYPNHIYATYFIF
jgi:hypothetical protein